MTSKSLLLKLTKLKLNLMDLCWLECLLPISVLPSRCIFMYGTMHFSWSLWNSDADLLIFKALLDLVVIMDSSRFFWLSHSNISRLRASLDTEQGKRVVSVVWLSTHENTSCCPLPASCDAGKEYGQYGNLQKKNCFCRILCFSRNFLLGDFCCNRFTATAML